MTLHGHSSWLPGLWKGAHSPSRHSRESGNPFSTFATKARWMATASMRSPFGPPSASAPARSEEHTSELQSLMRISYAVFCLKKKKENIKQVVINKINTYRDIGVKQ